ncbi:unnamed protein product [Fraxinus pennsylvanica]|uniref:Leucine-rich repeat-containing N-terminal plant-type domain-containing protein n=1 Tax=Fraxinus pennsylvanica TaxID=56036 RepID=A0AAD1Z6J8_9LAMI|nr:unnamed protein product [Fraxinus pennsylvanica]
MGRLSFLIKWHQLHKPLKFLILLLVLFSSERDVVLGSGSDRSALLELKDSISDPYGVLTSWNLNNRDHCLWAGVLSMPFNELSGYIPVEIWGMEKLEVLDLEGNLISGSLPSQFKGLKILKVLNLGFNEIFGGMPSSLLNCMGLQILNLAGNQVNGSIPRFIGEFRNLRGLYLSFNLLGGSIPGDVWDNCGKLEHLELAGNFFTGSIPKSLGKCRGLKTLLLNNFGGAIPSDLGNCTMLSVLVLSNLWDPLPNISSFRSDISTEKLALIADEYNLYEGTIPAEITSLSSLRMVWAPRATLDGKLPDSWGFCANLEMLNLAQNYYSGKVSEGLATARNCIFLT